MASDGTGHAMREEVHSYRYQCDEQGCYAHESIEATSTQWADDVIKRQHWTQNGYRWFCPAHPYGIHYAESS